MKHQYISVKAVADSIYRNPLLQDISTDDIIKYTTDFVNIVSLPGYMEDNIATVEVNEYRGILPCGLISITQVRDNVDKDAYINSSDTYYKGNNNYKSVQRTFKQQGRFIYTSEKNATLEISYKGYPTDDTGMLLIPESPVFIEALNQYITKEYMTILYYQGKIDRFVMTKVEQRYAWAVGRCEAEFVRPSLSEMEGIANINNQLINNYSQHRHSYRNMNNKQYLKNH